MGSGCSTDKQSRSGNYQPDPELASKKIESTSPAYSHFYGKGKPLDKSGNDSGLKEIYSGWNFPSSNEKSVVILPKWTSRGVQGNWSEKQFDPDFDPRLAAHGITEEIHREILSSLNELLSTFYPFQRDRKKTKKDETSDRGWNVGTKGIDINGTHNFYYALQMRKIIAKAGADFPTTSWSLHIHKHQDGGDIGLFIEKVYHSIQIDLAPSPPPGWWDKKSMGTGSYWHTWKGSDNDNSNGSGSGSSVTNAPPLSKGRDSPLPTLPSLGTSPPEAASTTSAAEKQEAEERLAKRKVSAQQTFGSLEEFAAKQQGTSSAIPKAS